MYTVEVGKGRSSYRVRYRLDSLTHAVMYYNGLNVHSGYKKRLRGPNGEVLRQVITY
jgi:hypothetical protein